MDDEKTLYIGNLDKNVTEEILYELFLQAGPIDRVNIPTSRNDYTCFGFVTYKHESSVNYAIELYKGTALFKKKLTIKKRTPRSNNPEQNNCDNIDQNARENQSHQILDFQGQLQALKLLAQNLTYGTSPVVNFTPNPLWDNNSSRNRSYDYGMKNHFSRPREVRDRWKDRNYGNKSYHRRKNRYRD